MLDRTPALAPALAVIAVLAAIVAFPACNKSYNKTSYSTGGRFQLTIEPARTDIGGTHFLIDSATGDLWRLGGNAGDLTWVRLADAPEDAADLTPPAPTEPDEHSD